MMIREISRNIQTNTSSRNYIQCRENNRFLYFKNRTRKKRRKVKTMDRILSTRFYNISWGSKCLNNFFVKK